MITQIQTNLKQAMLARETFKVSTLRMALTALNNEAISKGPGTTLSLSEGEVVIKRLIKSRQDSVEQFTKGGALDKAKAEQDEITILSAYLPKQLTDEELEAAVDEAIKTTKAATRKEMGAVMAHLKATYGNIFDAKRASTLVTARLA